MQATSISVADAMKNVTMTVRIKGFWLLKLRTRIGIRLIRLGARVIGCHFEVDITDK